MPIERRALSIRCRSSSVPKTGRSFLGAKRHKMADSGPQESSILGEKCPLFPKADVQIRRKPIKLRSAFGQKQPVRVC